MLAAGAEFDRYQVEAELGAGGMGQVYRAFDQRLQRRVALKVLLVDPLLTVGQQTEANARLVREARAAAAFEHPSKVSIFDVGTFEGAPYIAMELVQGRSLRAFIGKAEVPLHDRLTWLLEVARVLFAAHEAGLIHRDVKPENVMVRDGGGVKVLDFGIARRLAGPADGNAPTLADSIPTLTGQGVSVGTPLYMAPEQIRAESLDARVDQFAWGTMAYELVTGRHPFAAGRDMAGAVAAIASLEAPPFPAECGLPAGLGDAILRSMSKAPSERFETFEPLIAALRAEVSASASGQVPATLPSAVPVPAVTTQRGVAASMLPDAAAGRKRMWLLVLALPLALGVWLALRPKAEPALRQPTVGLSTMERYQNARGSEAMALESPTLWRAAADDFAEATQQDEAPARWRAAQLLSEGKALAANRKDERALDVLRQAVAAEPDWALAHVALCAAYSRLDRVDDALREAAHAERLEPTWWGGAAAAGSANAYAGKLEAAIEDYRRALAVAPDHPLLTADLALVYHASHIDAEAERLAKRALELDEALVSPRILLAERALERGDGQAALSEASRALAVLPKSVPARLAQADALLVLGREPEARDAYARALAVWKEAGGGGPFDERMQATERALASGALPSRTPTATAEPSSAPVASVPTRAPVRSPVPAAKKPAASPAPPGDRSSNDGRRGLDMGL